MKAAVEQLQKQLIAKLCKAITATGLLQQERCKWIGQT